MGGCVPRANIELPGGAVQFLKHGVEQDGERGRARAVGDDQKHPPVAEFTGRKMLCDPLANFAFR
jgi:hypothetical protein